MALTFPPKDPNEVLDYQLDWTARINGNAISNATFFFVNAASMEIEHVEYTDTTATVWLSGGEAGGHGILTCRITLPTSPVATIMDQTFGISIVDK